MAAIVDTAALLEVVWVSLLAGIGVTAVFSLVLLGGTRTGEARRAGAGTAAAGYAALTVLAGLVLVTGVGFGVRVLIAS